MGIIVEGETGYSPGLTEDQIRWIWRELSGGGRGYFLRRIDPEIRVQMPELKRVSGWQRFWGLMRKIFGEY